MYTNLSFFAVLGAGFLSFLSPCVLPLIPPYLCYMSGLSLEELNYKTSKKNKTAIRLLLVSSAMAFILGFSTVFITLGASATTLGSFLNVYRSYFATLAGIIIIIIGLNFLGIFRLSIFYREARFQTQKRKSNLLSAYLMGLAFAFGWTPCIGPILGPILSLAGTKETVSEGALLLATYCLGLGIPFLLSALFSDIFMHFLKKFRSHLGKVEKFIGICLVITGLLFLTGQMQIFSYWLLEYFPALSAM